MATTIRARIERLLPAPPAGPLPLSLPRRRIYILPSRFGLVYGVALLALLIGSLNYNNNAAILFSLLLAATALASAVVAVQFLAGLQVDSFEADEAFAGEAQPCRLRIAATGGEVRGELALRLADKHRVLAQPEADGRAVLAWSWPSQRRGRRSLGRIRLSTTYPLGLFHAWCVLQPEVEAIVYPAPESPPAPLPMAPVADGSSNRPRAGSEEWHALREFRRGDSLREIAWKTSARHDRWLVHEMHEGSTAQVLHFSLDQVAQLERERGLARLCRWVLTAEALQRPYGLDLGERRLGPDRGPHQRRRALTALADLP